MTDHTQRRFVNQYTSGDQSSGPVYFLSIDNAKRRVGGRADTRNLDALRDARDKPTPINPGHNKKVRARGSIYTLLRRPFATGVIGFHFVPIQLPVMVLVRLFHDLVRNPVCAAIGNGFLFRHDTIMICIAFLEVSQSTWIISSPFLGRESSVVVSVTRVEDFVHQKIARFISRKPSVMVGVSQVKTAAPGGCSLAGLKVLVGSAGAQGNSGHHNKNACLISVLHLVLQF